MYGMGSLSGNYLREYPRATQMVGHLRSGSQIGLNAIAQWCATLGNPLPQGLGTGEIFKDDKHRLIQRKGDTIWFSNDL